MLAIFNNYHKILKSTAGLFSGCCLLIYFIYHIFQGERGVFSWIRLQQKVAQDEEILRMLQSQRETMERRVTLLRSDNLDPDMLEERVRIVLNFAHPEEVIIYHEQLDLKAN